MGFIKGALLDRESRELSSSATLFTEYWCVWVCGWKSTGMTDYLFGILGTVF